MAFFFLYAAALGSLVLTGLIAGFFYAYACSVMVGFAILDPRTAIAAMQAINATVRNIYFAPAFFGPPLILAITTVLAMRVGARRAAIWFGAAAGVYLLGGLLLTMRINVPMNEALAVTTIPQDPAEALRLWADYAGPWQFWNFVRTVVGTLALVLTGLGLLAVQGALRPSAGYSVAGRAR
ncbi:DUF1772 domain-containing protein [Elstera cyanobacteriorum]|uniref:anthrone oxygenase family protein n=1 Tax=Elstera cyanobacteriorum TaxID=2022747 RepID=UPI0023572D7D|nr:anthrone oxygenase family protein [Elstera cyanobacteriorum]MCK6441142.1 DUF1772 domain-containing protein [Elstera cyanobacteriorum]